MNKDLRLTGSRGVMSEQRLRRVLKQENDIAKIINEVSIEMIEGARQDAQEGNAAEKKAARSFILEMKKLVATSEELQVKILELELDRQKNDIISKANSLDRIEGKQLKTLSYKHVEAVLSSLDDAEPPVLEPSPPTLLETISETSRESNSQ